MKKTVYRYTIFGNFVKKICTLKEWNYIFATYISKEGWIAVNRRDSEVYYFFYDPHLKIYDENSNIGNLSITLKLNGEICNFKCNNVFKYRNYTEFVMLYLNKGCGYDFIGKKELNERNDQINSSICAINSLDTVFNMKPISKIYFNRKKKVTTVMWIDGVVTQVKLHKGDKWNKETALAFAIAKRYAGSGRAFKALIEKGIDQCKTKKKKVQ